MFHHQKGNYWLYISIHSENHHDSEFQEDIDILRLLLSEDDREILGKKQIRTIADLVLWIEEHKDSNSTQRIVSSNSEIINEKWQKVACK